MECRVLASEGSDDQHFSCYGKEVRKRPQRQWTALTTKSLSTDAKIWSSISFFLIFAGENFTSGKRNA